MRDYSSNGKPNHASTRLGVVALALVSAFVAAVTAPACSLKSEGSGPANLERCNQVPDCVRPADACSYATCSAEGICGSAPVNDGISPTQLVGDCLLAKCTAGATVEEADAADSDDANPCTVDDCAMSPPHSPVADGTVCMLGASVGACQGGSCQVPCNAGKPCDDTNPCTTDTCDDASKLCIFTAFTGDAPVTDVDPTDCKKPYCAAGSLSAIANDAEIPDDGKACTTDTCAGGQPMHAPVAAGTSPAGCAAPQKCDGGGNCVNCTVAADCGAPTECSTPVCMANGVCSPGYHVAGEVVATQTPQDCSVRVCNGTQPTAVVQADPTDTQNDMNACTADTCTGTMPVHTATPGVSCMGTKFCNAAAACVDCYVSANCAPGSHCTNSICYSCSNGVQDPGETGIDCGSPACGGCAGDACGTGCAASLTCVDGTCCTASSCPDCSTCATANGTCQAVANGTHDGACVAPASCQGGACLKGQGQMCGGPGECLSGACVNGFCCNNACGTKCQACSMLLTGQPNGTCADVTHGTNPGNVCTSGQACCGPNICGMPSCP